MLTFKATEMEVTGTPTRVGSLEKGKISRFFECFHHRAFPQMNEGCPKTNEGCLAPFPKTEVDPWGSKTRSWWW